MGGLEGLASEAIGKAKDSGAASLLRASTGTKSMHASGLKDECIFDMVLFKYAR